VLLAAQARAMPPLIDFHLMLIFTAYADIFTSFLQAAAAIATIIFVALFSPLLLFITPH
jgi:hypothetical protein